LHGHRLALREQRKAPAAQAGKIMKYPSFKRHHKIVPDLRYSGISVRDWQERR
jgi:hypothetical protein